jgi:hypothetical protein
MVSLTADERIAAAFHKSCQRLAKDALCELVGSDHKASTITLRQYRDSPSFTVPFWWLDNMIDYYRRYM